MSWRFANARRRRRPSRLAFQSQEAFAPWRGAAPLVGPGREPEKHRALPPRQTSNITNLEDANSSLWGRAGSDNDAARAPRWRVALGSTWSASGAAAVSRLCSGGGRRVAEPSAPSDVVAPEYCWCGAAFEHLKKHLPGFFSALTAPFVDSSSVP